MARSSMGHCVKDNVNPQRIRRFLGELAKIVFIVALALPAVAKIGVVADHDHHAALVIVDGAVMDFLGVRSFPSDSSTLAARAGADIWNLPLRGDLENAVK